MTLAFFVGVVDRNVDVTIIYCPAYRASHHTIRTGELIAVKGTQFIPHL